VALAVDLLGHGESDRPLSAPYDLASQADVLERVLAALRLDPATVEPAIVVGQDVGALVALALAVRHPALVSHLVLVNPPDPAALPPTPVRAMLRMAGRSAMAAAGQTLGPAALLAPLFDDPEFGADGLSREARARFLASWVGPGGVEQLLLLARALEEDTLPLAAFREVTAPTLVVRGTADRSVPPTVAAAFAGTLPGASLESIAGAGRLLVADLPEAFTRRVQTWLAGAAFPVERP
jgi:pimeloyl-ACP methyl ester carboxylesterase